MNSVLFTPAAVNRYIRWTLYGVKPDTASPPLKSLQIREEEVAAGEADAESVDGVRMTMFYYNCSGPKGAPPCSDASSGHFAWRRSGHLREGRGGTSGRGHAGPVLAR